MNVHIIASFCAITRTLLVNAWRWQSIDLGRMGEAVGSDADCLGGGDVVRAIVEENDAVRFGCQAVQNSSVYCWIGFGHAQMATEQAWLESG